MQFLQRSARIEGNSKVMLTKIAHVTIALDLSTSCAVVERHDNHCGGVLVFLVISFSSCFVVSVPYISLTLVIHMYS